MRLTIPMRKYNLSTEYKFCLSLTWKWSILIIADKFTMSSLVVAVIGSTGYVGKCLMPTFLEALQEKKLKELRVLTSQKIINGEVVQSYAKAGANVI